MQDDGQARLYLLRNLARCRTVPAGARSDDRAGARYTISLEVRGTSPTTLSAKVWKSSDPEPAAWQRTGTDAFAELQQAGHFGVYTYLPGSASDRAPVTASWHSLQATRPPA